VLAADCPRNAGVTAGIAAVEFVPVVQPHTDIVCLVRGWTPLQDLFSPVHAHISVHPSQTDHLSLCGIPKRVVGLGVRELLFRVDMCAPIAGMLTEGAPRPRLDAREGPEARIVADKINRKLAPHDHFFKKRVTVAGGCRRGTDRERDCMRSDLTEMKVRREPAGRINFRMVAIDRIASQTVANKSTQCD